MINLLLWSLQATAILAVAALAQRCIRSARPAARLALWQTALLATLLLPILRPWQQEAVTITPVAAPGVVDVATSSAPALPLRSKPTPTQALEYLLLAGVALRLANLALGLFRLRRYRRDASPFHTRTHWHNDAEILISDAVPSPVTFGFLNPVILLPGHFASLEKPLQETILYHEILHVRRHDWLFAVAEETLRALLWFHPAIWWTIREIHLAREEAVDREVVETLNARETYVDALLAIAGTPLGRQWSPAPFFIRRKQLKHRVISIFREVTMSKKSSVSAFLAGACALAISCWLITEALPLKAAPQGVMDGPGVTVDTNGARLIHRSPVEFPFQTKIGGTVVAQVKTDANGNVVDATITSGPDELRKPVLQALLDWHFTHDSASSTRQITVTFTPPPAPPALAVPAANVAPITVAQAPMILSEITVFGLSDAERDQLLAQLPVHPGDPYTPNARAEVLRIVKAFDEHMTVGMTSKLQPDGTRQTSLTIALPGPSLMPVPTTQTAPPNLPAPAGSVRVGGAVAAQNLINQTKPVYPPLAKAARIQGTVKFQATIGKDGTVQNLQLISGAPLLVQAALQAVQQWVYKPTLLNGQPVEIVTTIDVNFTLSE
jgi:TonB family protein